MLLVVSARSWWDFHTTGIHHRWLYHSALAGGAIGLVSLATTPLGWTTSWVLAVAGGVLGVVGLPTEWALRRRPAAVVTRTNTPLPQTIPLSNGGQIVRHNCGGEEVAAAWDDIDEELPDSHAIVEYTDSKHRLPYELDEYSHEILKYKTSHRATFNGRLVRLDSDLTADALRQPEALRVSRTDYFSLLCSNYMAGWVVTDRKTGLRVLTGNELTIDGKGRLTRLSKNGLANVIGVSTLAFTSDGKLLLTWQSAGSQSSAGLAAPSGSGSIDSRDVRGWTAGRPFLDFISSAMERELVEESHLRYKEIEWTKVLGYFRWLTKGGKPEFVGVTRLKVTADELRRRDVRITETPWVQRIQFNAPISLDDLKANPDGLSCLDSDLCDQTSMPLKMSLRALGNALGRPTELAKILRHLSDDD